MKPTLRNVLSLGLGDAGSRAIGFLITIYLARVVEPSAFGMLNIGLGVLGYLALMANPGIQILEARNTARVVSVDSRRVSSILSLRLVLAVVMCLGVGLYVVIAEPGGTPLIVFLYSLSLIPLALMLDWFFQGKEQFVVVGAAKLITYIVYGFFVVMLVRSSADVSMTPVAFGIGNLVSALVLVLVFTGKFGGLRLHWHQSEWREVLTESMPVGLATLLGQGVVNLPPILIGLLLSTYHVGVFAAAMKLVFLLLLLDRLFNILFLPVVTRHVSQRPGEVVRLLTITIKVVSMTVLPLTLMGIVAASEIVGLVFGPGYDDAVPLLRFLLMYFGLTMTNSVLVCTMLATGREKTYTKVMLLSSVVFVIVEGVLIMAWGIAGAAIGVVVGECVTFLFMVGELRADLRPHVMRSLTKPGLAFALAGISLLLFRGMDHDLMLLISLGVFVVVSLLVRTFGKDDITFLRERFV
jgi:O-antigen/teichoic acid export membrane protein